MGNVTTGPQEEVYADLVNWMDVQGANSAAFEYYNQTNNPNPPTANQKNLMMIAGFGLGLVLLIMILKR